MKRYQHVSRSSPPLAVVLSIAATLFCACDRTRDWWLGPGENLGTAIASLRPNRMVIVRARPGEREQIADTRDPVSINAVLDLFKRHTDGWLRFSGAFGEYDILLYDDSRFLGRLGLRASADDNPDRATINVDNHFRRVPAADVRELASRLSIPWPPR